MRVTTVLVTALLVATCGNNDARTIDDGGKQKLLWQTGLLQFGKLALIVIINVSDFWIQVSRLHYIIFYIFKLSTTGVHRFSKNIAAASKS
jgi:hypothetical protein